MFTTDTQTISDFGIFDSGIDNSVYSLFNHVRTRGGAEVLEELFRYPLNDAISINRRSSIIAYFAAHRIGFPFDQEVLDIAEQYLMERDERTALLPEHLGMGQKVSQFVAADTTRKNIVKGIGAVIVLLQESQNFLNSEVIINCIPYAVERQSILDQLAESDFKPMLQKSIKDRLSQEMLAVFDKALRFRHYDAIRKLLHHIYKIDVYASITKLVTEQGFTLPKALPNKTCYISAEGFYHPLLKNAITNDIEITPSGNVIFLTGANMAGKSTLMKSLGINLYLAHMGFPVAAEKVEFSVLDGIYTTINLPDDLGMGVSHFYAEVLRLKKIAKELSRPKRLLVIFDELFRGTNVKDAFEGTIAVTKAFASRNDSVFIISTHITEAGEVLKDDCEKVIFKFLPTNMNGNTPMYSYKLESGITDDRHGMIIINNEGILDILEKGRAKSL